MSALSIRHILPGFSALPRDLTTSSMSGIVGTAYHIATEHSHAGHALSLVGMVPEGDGDLIGYGDIEIIPITPWRFAQLGPYDFRIFAPMASKLRLRRSVDIHHVYSNPFHLGLGTTTHEFLHYQTPVDNDSVQYQRSVQRASQVLCCSEFIRTQFLEHVDYPEEKTHVVYNGVDLNRFQAVDAAQKAQYREDFGLPADKVLIMFAGQITHEKGFLHLVHALRELNDDRLHLVTAGSSLLWNSAGNNHEISEYEREVRELLKDMPHTWLGNVPFHKMASLYGAVDVFTLPSTWQEPFGIVIVEAMAMGLPVVATQVGGIPEIILDGETGFLVPPADSKALADAFRKLADDPDLRQRMGAAGKVRSEQFSWARAADAVAQIYSETLGEPIST